MLAQSMMIYGYSIYKTRTRRSGIIPYTKINEEIFFLLSRHTDTKEYGDFGGGVRKDETALDAGLREFHEESSNVFLDLELTTEKLLTCVTLHDKHTDAVIIFLYIDADWMTRSCDNFNWKHNPNSEVSSIMWFNESEFHQLIFNTRPRKEIMWSRIRLFFQRVYTPDFMDTLKLLSPL